MGRERQKQKSEEIRRSILDTAMELGLEEGFEQISIRKITNKLGYSAGSVYYYFKDRQEIIDTIHQEASQLIRDKIQGIIQIEKGFEYNNRAIFSMILELALEQPEKYNLIVLDKYGKRKETISPWIGLMEQTIRVGIASGELRELDASLTAFNIWSSFLGLMIMISSRKEINQEYAIRLFENQMEMTMEGIRR